MFEASEFVCAVERAQDLLVCVPEEVAFVNGWLTREELLAHAEVYGNSAYGAHLRLAVEGALISKDTGVTILADAVYRRNTLKKALDRDVALHLSTRHSGQASRLLGTNNRGGFQGESTS